MYTVHVLKVILDNLTIKKNNLNITGMFLFLRSRSRNQLQGEKILDPETSQKNGSNTLLYTQSSLLYWILFCLDLDL